MPPDRLRTPIATKNLLRPLELMVTDRSLKRAGGVVPLGGWALDVSLALIQAALILAYRLIFHERGRMSLPDRNAPSWLIAPDKAAIGNTTYTRHARL
jgi:hypothetical protein